MQPPAEGLASRLLLGPALRTQPDRRLVTLVRAGYETAFEEIVRRYGQPLGRYAASIVGSRSEDVTQDAFSKALLAMRRNDAEIDLRPWLFRIVRNTALNDLRDRAPSPEVLAESLVGGGGNPSDELERREELADLMRRLQALPEAQRAAIVMRELEGLSHEEIARALGMSGGAARQAIYRARRALRDGIGMLVPLPLLQSMLAVAATTGANEAAAGMAGMGGAAGAGMGAGMALKATAATVLVAGAVGAGVAVEQGQRVEKAEAGPPLVRGAPESPAAVRDGGPSPGDAPAADEQTGGHGNGKGRHVSASGQGAPGRSGSHGGGQNPGPSGSGHRDSRRPAGDDGDHHSSLADDRSGHSGPGSGGDRGGVEAGDDSHSGPGSGGEELEQVSRPDGEEAPEQIEDGGESGSGSSSGSGSGSESQLDGHSGSG